MASKIAPPVRFGVLSSRCITRTSGRVPLRTPSWRRSSEFGTTAPGVAMAAAKEYGTAYWADLDALLGACDAVAITSETLNHVELAERAAARGCHIW